MSASDPSGAEMRSPNENFAVVNGLGRIVDVCPNRERAEGAAAHQNEYSSDAYKPFRAERLFLESEVSPRSSGGPDVEGGEDVYDLLRLRVDSDLALPFTRQCRELLDRLFREHHALRTQVSALRQEAAALRVQKFPAILAEQDAELVTLRAELSAARREAETLRGTVLKMMQAAQRHVTRGESYSYESGSEPIGVRGGHTTSSRGDLCNVRDELETLAREYVGCERDENRDLRYVAAARVAAPREPK